MFREEAGRLTASLVRLLGDFDLAEEMVSEAVTEALVHWPRQGVPERPGAWLLTTARRKGIDRVRRDARYRQKLQLLAAVPDSLTREPDDRLRLIFTCCHPALEPDARVALTLRAVAGLSAPEIARAFLVSEAAVAKRLTRAKRKITTANIAYRAPEPHELCCRLQSVLQVIYLIFNEGYVTTSGLAPASRELADDGEWLASLVVRWLPDEPEPLGLLALIRLHLARFPARFDAHGHLVLLEHQDRARFDVAAIDGARRLLERAASFRRLGPYQVEAAIAALHCEAPTFAATDWAQVVALYSVLARLDPSPVVLLNRAVALGHLEGPAAALAEVEGLGERLSRYHLFHATRAEMLRRLGRPDEARRADQEALALTANRAERLLLSERLADDR